MEPPHIKKYIQESHPPSCKPLPTTFAIMSAEPPRVAYKSEYGILHHGKAPTPSPLPLFHTRQLNAPGGAFPGDYGTSIHTYLSKDMGVAYTKEYRIFSYLKYRKHTNKHPPVKASISQR